MVSTQNFLVSTLRPLLYGSLLEETRASLCNFFALSPRESHFVRPGYKYTYSFFYLSQIQKPSRVEHAEGVPNVRQRWFRHGLYAPASPLAGWVTYHTHYAVTVLTHYSIRHEKKEVVLRFVVELCISIEKLLITYLFIKMLPQDCFWWMRRVRIVCCF